MLRTKLAFLNLLLVRNTPPSSLLSVNRIHYQPTHKHKNSHKPHLIQTMATYTDYYKEQSQGAASKTSNGYDAEGFDPEADTVGPGIYGGRVKIDEKTGQILWGKQYQNHNPNPGPIYSGTGYTDMTKALSAGKDAIDKVLQKDSKLVNEITTGGATPLHMCGMSRRAQLSTKYIIEKGGNIEALDTYGYTPLHRMASNDLSIGAQALLEAGANAFARTKYGEDAMSIAEQSRAYKVVKVLKEFFKE